MLAADDREEGNRVEDEEERTGDAEEVAHHQIGRPCRLQLRQAVKHIEGVLSLPLDQVVNIHRKILKPVVKRHLDGLHLRTVLHKRLVAREAEIDDVPLIRLRLADIGLHKQPKLRKVRHSPDNIVTEPDIVKRLVHLRDTAFHFIKRCHRALLSEQKRRFAPIGVKRLCFTYFVPTSYHPAPPKSRRICLRRQRYPLTYLALYSRLISAISFFPSI